MVIRSHTRWDGTTVVLERRHGRYSVAVVDPADRSWGRTVWPREGYLRARLRYALYVLMGWH